MYIPLALQFCLISYVLPQMNSQYNTVDHSHLVLSPGSLSFSLGGGKESMVHTVCACARALDMCLSIVQKHALSEQCAVDSAYYWPLKPLFSILVMCMHVHTLLCVFK